MSVAGQRGWFLLHRGWMQSPDFHPEPFTEREAFLWSIEMAAFEPHCQWFNRVQVPVGRGEFVTSIRKMATAFQWGDKHVRGFIARMERCGKWTCRGAHPFRIVTVCNYELFQAPAKGEGTPKGKPRAGSGQAQGTQQKEGINNSNELEGKELEASPLRSPDLPYADAVKAWTQVATLKGWTPLNPELTDKRKRGLGKTLSVHGLGGFVSVLQEAMDSEWLGGPDPPPWFNFTFVCSPENFAKLKDGNYARNFSNQRSSDKPSPWLAARDRLSGQGLSDAASSGATPGAEQLQQLRLPRRDQSLIESQAR